MNVYRATVKTYPKAKQGSDRFYQEETIFVDAESLPKAAQRLSQTVAEEALISIEKEEGRYIG
jgi:hypothetical protein